jgi:hypothetical protein
MSPEFTCEQCKSLLYDVVDGGISDADRQSVNAHLEHCQDCNTLLAELWDLAAMATRWQDRPVPHWNRRGHFFEPRSWFSVVQVASACASVLVLILVMAQVQVSAANGLTVHFGDTFASPREVARQIDALRAEQQTLLKASMDQLSNRQAASDQLVLRTLLETSRSERRQDMSNMLAVLQEVQTQEVQRTEASLKYLIAGQLEDRRDIHQLGQAIRLVANEGGTL